MFAAGAVAAAGAEAGADFDESTSDLGAGILDVGTAESKSDRFARLPMIVKLRDVMPKIAARTKVVLVKKLAPPELPKTVLLEPPSVALISAPFPDCIRTTMTMSKQVRMWITVTKVAIIPRF